MSQEFRPRYRSYRHPPGFFFPVALITAGIVWLLVNNGTIPVDNLYRLLPLWPALLILAGLGLLVRRIWWPINALMWVVTGALVIWLLTAGSAFLPNLNPLELKHETVRQALAQTTSADVQLDLSIHPTTIHALTSGDNLLVADVYTINGIVLDASGGAQKNVNLHESLNTENFVFNPRIGQWLQASSMPWDIGLSPAVPLVLTVSGGTARTDLQLAGLDLKSLQVNAGTGRVNLSIPQSETVLPVHVDMGTGQTNISLPANTPVDLTVSGGTGGLQINLPQNAGVQVNVRNAGLGGLTMPAGFDKVSGDSQSKEGIWQNPAFVGAKTPINIVLDIGTGGVTIK